MSDELKQRPQNIQLVYGKMLRKDNPLISAWVEAANDSLTKERTVPDGSERLFLVQAVMSLLERLLLKMFCKEEKEEDGDRKPTT
jgi:hypothetical protein